MTTTTTKGGTAARLTAHGRQDTKARGSTKGNGKPTHERWPVAALKENPRQQEMFGDVGDAELEALIEDVRTNGLNNPLHVLPGGILLAGNQRLRAVRKLGWTHVPVVVRRDLAEAGAAACERYLINDNLLLRRRRSGLGKARRSPRRLERAGSRGEELKGGIAGRMGISLRSVKR